MVTLFTTLDITKSILEFVPLDPSYLELKNVNQLLHLVITSTLDYHNHTLNEYAVQLHEIDTSLFFHLVDRQQQSRWLYYTGDIRYAVIRRAALTKQVIAWKELLLPLLKLHAPRLQKLVLARSFYYSMCESTEKLLLRHPHIRVLSLAPERWIFNPSLGVTYICYCRNFFCTTKHATCWTLRPCRIWRAAMPSKMFLSWEDCIKHGLALGVDPTIHEYLMVKELLKDRTTSNWRMSEDEWKAIVQVKQRLHKASLNKLFDNFLCQQHVGTALLQVYAFMELERGELSNLKHLLGNDRLSHDRRRCIIKHLCTLFNPSSLGFAYFARTDPITDEYDKNLLEMGIPFPELVVCIEQDPQVAARLLTSYVALARELGKSFSGALKETLLLMANDPNIKSRLPLWKQFVNRTVVLIQMLSEVNCNTLLWWFVLYAHARQTEQPDLIAIVVNEMDPYPLRLTLTALDDRARPNYPTHLCRALLHDAHYSKTKLERMTQLFMTKL